MSTGAARRASPARYPQVRQISALVDSDEPWEASGAATAAAAASATAATAATLPDEPWLSTDFTDGLDLDVPLVNRAGERGPATAAG